MRTALISRFILIGILIAIVGCVLMFSSCSDALRMQRIEARHPEWVKSDTITKSDTTIISEVKADSTFIWQHLIDTVTITKDRLRAQIIRDHDTLRLAAECGADTVIKERIVYIHTLNPPQPISKFQCFLMWSGGILWILIVIAAAIFLFIKLKPGIKIP